MCGGPPSRRTVSNRDRQPPIFAGKVRATATSLKRVLTPRQSKSADGRVKSKTAPDWAPETCRSAARRGHAWACGATARWWPRPGAHERLLRRRGVRKWSVRAMARVDAPDRPVWGDGTPSPAQLGCRKAVAAGLRPSKLRRSASTVGSRRTWSSPRGPTLLACDGQAGRDNQRPPVAELWRESQPIQRPTAARRPPRPAPPAARCSAPAAHWPPGSGRRSAHSPAATGRAWWPCR